MLTWFTLLFRFEAKISALHGLKANILASSGLYTQIFASASAYRPNVWPRPRNIGHCLDLLALAWAQMFRHV